MKRHLIRTLTALIFIGILAASVEAQTSAQERAANLRQQLAEVQAKQTELETRLQQLEEDLKPENIEKTLAGVGSTKPEELREQRRRQLEIEKKSVQTRLDQLSTSRSRLETGILQADAAVYHSSAEAPTVETEKAAGQGKSASSPTASPTSRNVQRRAKRHKRPKMRPRRGD
jgi:chromosome segregation ATPase